MAPSVILSFAALGLAFTVPLLFWYAVGALVLASILFLATRHTVAFCVAWVLIAGMSLEMTLTDLVGPEAFQSTIAAIKAAQIGLAGLAALRWGVRIDPLNPALVFIGIGVIGILHGLAPGLTAADSLRSLIGSVAPFAFGFVRLRPAWASTMIRVIPWCPLAAVLGGGILAMAGVRPLFVDSGGMRLAGLGHPAFLANVCLPAIYAGLIGLWRDGRSMTLALLGVNLAILLLTGARAPLLCAAAVTVGSLLFVSGPAFPLRRRMLTLLLIACAIPPAALLSGDLAEIRLFNLLNTDLANLSGREILWPVFEAAAARSPWFGWGLGAGNAIIPPDDPVARLLHTWAAHNEYLRIQVEGGEVGRALLILVFIAWVWIRTLPLPGPNRRIMRLIFIALAVHACTDNVLISTPACVLFTLAAAVFSAPRSTLPDSTKKA